MMEINKKAMKLIEFLLFGYEVKIGDETYKLMDDYELCVRRECQWTGGSISITWLKVLNGGTLSHYMKLAEEVTEEQLFLLGADKVLTEINRER